MSQSLERSRWLSLTAIVLGFWLSPSWLAWNSGVILAQQSEHQHQSSNVSWQKFLFPAGGFSLLLPSQPSERLSDTDLHYFQAVSFETNTLFRVRYSIDALGSEASENPNWVSPRLDEAQFRRYRSQILGNAEIIRERDISQGESLSRELLFKSFDGSFHRLELHLINGRFYALEAVSPEAFNITRPVEGVFQSFYSGVLVPIELTGQKKPVILYNSNLEARDIRLDVEINFYKAIWGGPFEVEVERLRLNSRGQLELQKQVLMITIPLGIDDGARLRVLTQGHASLSHAPGHLYIYVSVPQQDGLFERQGTNIFSKLRLTPELAKEGGKIWIETVDGLVQLSIPVGVERQTKLKIPGLGVPFLGSAIYRGDHIVIVDY